MVSPVQTLTEPLAVTIPSGTSITAAINLRGRVLAAVVTPATWTAANLTFQGSADGATFFDLYSQDGAEEVATAAASRFIAIDTRNFLPVNFLKVRSGTAAVAVNQAADRVLTLMLGHADKG